MSKEKINRIFAVSMMVLGALNICFGLFYDSIPHDYRIFVAISQILVGCVVLYTSILKIKGKF